MTAPGRVTLVLLPGLDGTSVFFRPLLAALPSWVEPLVIEYPSDGGDDYPHLLALVSEAVRGLDAYWVLGWSFSGPLALMLAARDPDRVRGVILCASFVRATNCTAARRPWSIWPAHEMCWCRAATLTTSCGRSHRHPWWSSMDRTWPSIRVRSPPQKPFVACWGRLHAAP